MPKVTKLHPNRTAHEDLLEETLGEIAVEAGFKLPESEAELEIYESSLGSEPTTRITHHSDIYEALAEAENSDEIRYKQKSSETKHGTYSMAARNSTDELDSATVALMNAAADEDEND